MIPLARRGPRPLVFHLSIALATLLSSNVGLQLLKKGVWPWNLQHPHPISTLAEQIRDVDPQRLEQALGKEVRHQLNLFFTGLEQYRRHPYRRTLVDPPVIWHEGSSRLLDYGGQGQPVLFIPSLINRCYILDLFEDCSLMRWLSEHGIRPLLMDFGAPSDCERQFNLTDYIAGRLERALQVIISRFGRCAVVGYCMGGLLALALAVRNPHVVDRLVLMASPWDFHTQDLSLIQVSLNFFSILAPNLEIWGDVPVDVLQLFFAGLDPFLVLRKFQRFANVDPDSAQARRFVALEDWLNDGISLSMPVARECLFGWYGRNEPAMIQWAIAGEKIDPTQLSCPTLIIVPAHDRIVPPTSARSVANKLVNPMICEPPLGHIGMIIGRQAVTQAWLSLAEFLSRET